jgi:deaminated glutathione amidase
MTMSAPVRVAAIQTVSGPDVAANLRVAEALLAEAAAQGAQIAALPEYFGLISSDERAKVVAREQPGHGEIQAMLGASARRHGMWIIGGTLPLVADAPERVRNSVLVFDAKGEQAARYDKIHLFGFDNGGERYDESRTIEAGSEAVALDSPYGRLGLSVCYDLRFPELYRALGVPDIIFVPSAFTATTGRAHWETLLRARAIENQCYVVAPAQGGEHAGGRRTWGHTMIVDPWGEILACRVDDGPGVVVAELDPQRIATVRRQLPALAHRRIGVAK